MKKKFKILLASLVVIVFACCGFACAGGQTVEVAPDVIGVTQGGVQDSYGPAYGEEPDLDNVIVDGYLQDQLWTADTMKWYTHYESTPRIKYEMATSLSQKGLYVAFRSYDPFVAWTGYNYFFKNTNVVFNIYASELGGNDVVLTLDANNLKPCNWYVNARSRYYGQLNQYGLGDGISAEIFMTWADMGVELSQQSTPTSIRIMPVYNYRPTPSGSATSQMLPTFVKTIGNINQAVEFDKNGYVDCDGSAQSIGSHQSGLSKTVGWEISTDQDGNEVVQSDMNAIVGAPLAVFFKNSPAVTRYRMSATLSVSEISTDSRFGLLSYRDSINYRAVAFSLRKTAASSKMTLRGYTNYPSNITATTDFCEVDKQLGDQVELTVYNNSGSLYYVVDGELVASEVASYVSTNNYIGLYAFGASAQFTNCDYVTYSTEKELLEDLASYAYTINVYDDNPAQFLVTTDSIAVSKDGGSVQLTMTFSEGITAEDILVEDIETGEIRSIIDSARTAVGGVFSLPVSSSIAIYTTPTAIDESQLVEVMLTAKDKETLEDISGFSGTAIGNGPFTRFTTPRFSYGGIVMKIPKGYHWKYSASAFEYALTEGDLFGGEIINDATDEVGVFYMKSYTLGGVARSILGEDGQELTSFSKSSTAGSVWDVSRGEEGLMTFQTAGSVGANQVYFSGRTICDYQVAYAEIVNRTDPSAFTSLENDPAAGFLIAGENQTTLVGLYSTGIRILKDYPKFDETRVEAKGIMPYEGLLATIDRTNGGRFIGTYPGKGSVNRLPDGDKEYVTSLLMIRKNGYVYIYACDGPADLTEDKTNIEKMSHIYTYNDQINTGFAAIGFGVTVAYNLRVDFQDFWLLTDKKASDFADDMISSEFTVQNTAGVDVNGDALLSRTQLENSVTGEIATGSKLLISAKDKNLGDKILKVVSAQGETYYIHKNNLEIAVPTGKENNYFTVEEVEGIKVSGRVVNPNGEQERAFSGSVINSSGDKMFDITTDTDGQFSVMVEKNAGVSVVFNCDGYVMIPTEVVSDSDLGELSFQSSPIGGDVVQVDGVIGKTAEGVELGMSEQEGLYFTYKTDSAKNGGVYVKTQYLSEDMVVDYTVQRKPMPISLGLSEDKDTSVGISLYGTNGSYGMRFIGTGYRIQLNDLFDKETNISMTGVSPVNFSGNSTTEPYNLRFIKKGENVYMCAKLSSESTYTLVYAMNVYQHLGSMLTDIKISWASSGYLDLRFTNVNVSGIDDQQFTDMVSNMKAADIFVTGTDVISLGGAGLISFDEQTGSGKFVKGSELIICADKLEQDQIATVMVNGIESELLAGEKLVLKPGGSGDVIVSAQKNDCYTVTGAVVAPNEISLSAVYGLVIDGKGAEKSVVEINADGSFKAIVRKDQTAYVCFYTPNYVMQPVEIDKSMDVGKLTFVKSYVVSSLTLENGEAGLTAPETRYALDVDGTVSVNYKAERGVNQGVYIAKECLKEDMVIYFSFERNKMPNGLSFTEDGDMSMGIVFTGAQGSYGMRFIGTGYRIQRNDIFNAGTNVANSFANSPVNMKNNPTPEPYDFKFIKVGSDVYMCAKLRSEDSYVMVKHFDLMNQDFSVGSTLTDVKISWATSGWTDVRISGIRIEDVTAQNSTEITK